MPPRDDPPVPEPGPPRSPALRAAALLLVLLGSVPLPFLLDEGRTGPAGAAAREVLRGLAPLLGLSAGLTLALTVAFVLLPSTALWVERIERAVRRGLGRGPAGAWVAGAGAVALAGALAAQAVLLSGEPTLVDEMSQLAHARQLAGLQPEFGAAGGAEAGAGDAGVAAVRLQNGTIVDGRWVSIYPPGHTLLLAGAMRVGALHLVGPLLWAASAALATLLFLRLLGGGSRVARAAGAVTAMAPMGWLIGAGWLSHPAALCASLVAAVAAERGWRAVGGEKAGVGPGGRAGAGGAPEVESPAQASRGPVRPGAALGWGVLLGAAAGWAVTTRPLTGLVLAVVLPALLLLRARALPVLLGALAGGLPFAVGLGTWNARLFGSPTTFGYSAAFGPSHGLGFHTDPWGNGYGPIEAIGWTASDLILVGPSMFGVPLPLAALIGVALAFGIVPRGARLALLWIGALVAANALYWHHGLHFGPRMLFETLPAWALLGCALFAHAVRRAGARGRVALWSGAVVALGLAITVHWPGLLRAADVGDERIAQLPPAPAIAALPDSAVVAVVGSWSSRVAARLAAQGVRADSIETALRRNGLCRVHDAARALESGIESLRPPATVTDSTRVRVAALGVLDLVPRPGTPDSLARIELAPGIAIRQQPGRPFSAECRAEARAEVGGAVLELEALRWRIARPDLTWIRSLGAAEDRAAGAEWMVVRDLSTGRPEIVPVEEGVRRVWGAPAGIGGGEVSGTGSAP